jgi:outer membrane protein TolC
MESAQAKGREQLSLIQAKYKRGELTEADVKVAQLRVRAMVSDLSVPFPSSTLCQFI